MKKKFDLDKLWQLQKHKVSIKCSYSRNHDVSCKALTRLKINNVGSQFYFPICLVCFIQIWKLNEKTHKKFQKWYGWSFTTDLLEQE